MNAPSAIIVFTTAPGSDKADAIAHTLVAERLAACATIIPGVTSVYWWEEEICREKEVMILVKTERHLFPELMKRVKELHDYQIPEIVAIPVTDGLPAYLEWVKSATKPM